MILSQFCLPPIVTTYFPKDHLTKPGSRTQISTVQITQPFTWQDEESVLSTKQHIFLWTTFHFCDFEKIFVHIKSLYCHWHESPFCTAPSFFQVCQKVTCNVSSVFSWPAVWAFAGFHTKFLYSHLVPPSTTLRFLKGTVIPAHAMFHSLLILVLDGSEISNITVIAKVNIL